MFREYQIVVENGQGERAALVLAGAGFEICEQVKAFVGDVLVGFVQSELPFDLRAVLQARGIQCALVEML